MVYFRNMKMVFPVVRLCLTIPPPQVCYSEYSDISDYWISTYCYQLTGRAFGLEKWGEERGRVVRVQTKTEFETMKFAEQNNDEEEIPT